MTRGEMDLKLKNRGFTLVETLLAIVMTAALVVSVGYMMIVGMDSYRLVVDRREALQQSRLAANMMATELATIQDPTTEISAISSSAISFTNADGEAVTYQILGTNLTRNGTVLASSLNASSAFSYFTQNGSSTSDIAQVYRINFSIAVDAESTSSGTVVIMDSIYLRNRYFTGFTRL